jgi:hypothetical protein
MKMGIETARTGKLLYHLTKLDNFDSIVRNGLLPRKHLLEQDCRFADVADPEIILRRNELGLDIYTPFHFHPYSAFDVAVKNKFVGQELIYLCIERELARYNKFRILPKHPLTIEDCTFYDYDEGIDKIDWDTLMEVGRLDDYAKHVKMAECITEKRISINYLTCIYVSNIKIKETVLNILNQNNVICPPPHINVQPKWFL